MRKLLTMLLTFLAVSAFADLGEVSVITVKTDGSKIQRRCKLVPQGDGAFRFAIPARELTADIKDIEILGDFAKAKKGESGYFVIPPNSIGSFTQETGTVAERNMALPVFGMKTPRGSFVAIVKGLRFEFSTVAAASGGNYVLYPRFHIGEMGGVFYEDLVVDFYELKAPDDGYPAMARLYRKYQLDRGEVVPLRERVKDRPALKYSAESIFVRFSQGSKRRDLSHWLQTDENLPTFDVYLTSDKFMEKMRKIHEIGMRNVEVCFVAWNIEGFEGRLPDLFPPDPRFGGEAKMKEAIAFGKQLGFQMTNHVCNMIFNRRAERFSEDAVAKRADGTLLPYSIKAIPCGQAFVPCMKVVAEKYTDEDYEGMKALGFEKGLQHLDVTSAVLPHACFDPRHPCTRKQTAEYENAIGLKCREYFGGFSSEAGVHHVAKTLDFAMYTTTFFHRKVMWKKWRIKPNFMLDNRTIPFWQIVYHGIILSNPDWDTIDLDCDLKDESDPALRTADTPDFNLWRRLQLWEFGGRPVFYWNQANNLAEVKKIYDRYQKVSRLQYEFMDDHREISKGVFLTKYSDGSIIITNYTKKPFEYCGAVVPAEDFALIEPSNAVSASVCRQKKIDKAHRRATLFFK